MVDKDFLSRHQGILLFSLFVVSLLIRVAWTYTDFTAKGMAGWTDARVYLAVGESFAAGNFYPEANGVDPVIMGPVIPLLVAMAKSITGDPVWPLLALNCLIGALLTLVLFHLGKRLASDAVGYILAGWSVLNLALIKFSSQILKEPLVILLVPLTILGFVNILQRRQMLVNVLLSVLSFSLLIHTDERFFVYTPLYILLLPAILPRKIKFNYSALGVGLLLLTMVPWTVRNYIKFNELVIISPRTTAVTSKLWGTDLTGLFTSERINSRHVEARQARALEAGQKNGVRPRQYGQFEKYWKAFAHYWKPAYFNLTYIQYGFRPIKWSLPHNITGLLFFGIFLPFYLVGLIYSLIKRNWPIAISGMLPLLHSLLHTIMVWPLERYRLPLDSLVVLVALWFVWKMSCNIKQRGSKASAGIAVGVACSGSREQTGSRTNVALQCVQADTGSSSELFERFTWRR